MTSRLNINDGAIYSLIRPGPAGIYSVPTEPIIASIPRKLPVGVYQVQNLLRRGIHVPLLLEGTNLSDLTTNIRALWAFLYSDVRADLMSILDYTAANDKQRYIEVTLAAEADIEEWFGWMTNRPGAGRVTLPLDCPDPTFYDPDPKNASGTFNGITNVTISCANGGDESAYPQIMYTTDGTNTLVNPQVTDNAGNVFKIENTMAINKALLIGANPQAPLVYYGSTNWFGQRSSASIWPVITPGTHDLTFAAANAAANAAIFISWYDRYSTHG